MTYISDDALRAVQAAKVICGDRDPRSDSDRGAVLVTMETLISIILITAMGTPEKAARMLNDGVLQGVEARLAMYANKRDKP